MGERVSTTSSIFHHNMFFMNCDIDKYDATAPDSQKKDFALSPLKIVEDKDHSTSGCGGLNNTGAKTDLQLNMQRLSAQLSEGRHLLPEQYKVQEMSNNFTDTQSQGQNYMSASVFKYNDAFETYSEMHPKSTGIQQQAQRQSPTKHHSQNKKQLIRGYNYSVEKAFERSQDGGSIHSNENMDDFPIDRFDFLTNDYEEDLDAKKQLNCQRTQERIVEDRESASPLAPLLEKQPHSTYARSHFAASFHRTKQNTSQDNDNKSSGSVDRAILLNKVTKASSNHRYKPAETSTLIDVNFMAAQQLGNNQFQIKGLKNKDQVRLLLDALKNKNIHPLGTKYFHETVILDLKNFSDCAAVRRALNELNIGVKTTSENPDQFRSRRIIYGQQLELIQEKENDHIDWSNSDADKSLSDKDCDISHKGRSNPTRQQFDLKECHKQIGLFNMRSPSEGLNVNSHRRFKHSNSQKFFFNKGRAMTNFGGSIASFHSNGNVDDPPKLRANSSHQFVTETLGQDMFFKKKNGNTLSGRSDSLKSHNLLQFK